MIKRDPSGKSCPKTGYSLIELTIAMAVIGVLIGAVFYGGAAVSGRMRYKTTAEYITTMVANTRQAFYHAPQFLVPTAAQVTSWNVFPPNVGVVSTGGGGTFMGQWNEVVSYMYPQGCGPCTDSFGILFFKIPQSACMDILMKMFGANDQVKQMGLISARNVDTGTELYYTAFDQAKASQICSINPLGLNLNFALRAQ